MDHLEEKLGMNVYWSQTCKMLAKNAIQQGVVNNKESVAGVVLRVFAAGEVGKAMDVMDHLEEKLGMNVYWSQKVITLSCDNFILKIKNMFPIFGYIMQFC